MTPQEQLRQFAQRVHLSDQDVSHLLALVAEAVRREREGCAWAGRHAAALWQAAPGPAESVADVVADAIMAREV